jgi:hypothetical protein
LRRFRLARSAAASFSGEDRAIWKFTGNLQRFAGTRRFSSPDPYVIAARTRDNRPGRAINQGWLTASRLRGGGQVLRTGPPIPRMP